jgi:6-pyruvoyltetrahydropterin/6-carboxytetrahydropterin synthase
VAKIVLQLARFMFEISVQAHFSGAHFLAGYPGVCANLHGHNWAVEVFLRGRTTDSMGLLMDFKQAKTVIHAAVDALDHKELNALPMFTRQNPSSENLARYFFRDLSKRLNSRRVKVHRVWVSESPGTSAAYWETE